MRKLTVILFFSFFSFASFGQMEVGYNTTDIGGEFQWYKDGKFIGLHVAANSKLHNSFHAEIGYYIAGDPTATFYKNQTNGGLGLGFGFRYYTLYRPHAFFVGVKANVFNYKVTLTTQTPETSKSTILIPALETGYMILINDMFFITPSVSLGYKTNLQSKLKSDEKKAVALIGISTGFKF